jgi:hypothetical protein
MHASQILEGWTVDPIRRLGVIRLEKLFLSQTATASLETVE